MTRLVIEVTSDLRSQGEYHVFESPELRVGRGFGNDLILSDPYVSEQHLVIARHGNGIRIRDLGSKNGTYLPSTKRAVAEAAIASGDALIVGTTKLRIFTDTHQIPPARALHPTNASVRWLRNPIVAWSALGILTGLTVLEGYLETDATTSAVKLLPRPIMTLIEVFLWAGAWSFVGRLTRHKIRFFIHVSMICVFLILGGLFSSAWAYVEYYLNSPVLGGVLTHASWGGLSIGLLYLSFAFATNLQRRKRLLASGACVLLGSAAMVGLLAAHRDYYFTGAIPYSNLLKAPALGTPVGESIEEFVTRTGWVFDFDLRAEK